MNAVLLSIRVDGTGREVELLRELLATGNKVVFVHYVGVKAGIIVILVLIDAFLVHNV